MRNDLPQRWLTKLDEYLHRPEAKYSNLSLADFHNNLRIRFEDGSNIYFKYAFYLKDIELKEVAVFTEHCGYHIFPFCLEKVEIVDIHSKIVSTDSAVID